jgi:hypothetical protein
MADCIINGGVISRISGTGVSKATVLAWYQEFHFIGAGTTEGGGNFEISFDEALFGGKLPDTLAEVKYKLFYQGQLIAFRVKGSDWNPEARIGYVEIETELQPEAMGSTEVAVHEIGDSLAATAAQVQQELTRYPNTLGAFLLDELELNVPVRLRVDGLGQVMVNMVEGGTGAGQPGNLRLRLRPVLGASVPASLSAVQPLQKLNIFLPETITRLETYRLFSVADFLRVAHTAAGRAALNALNLGFSLEEILDRAWLLTLPMLPPVVAEELLQLGIDSPRNFVQENAVWLAKELSNRLNEPIRDEDVECWQKEVRQAIALPLPSRHLIQ